MTEDRTSAPRVYRGALIGLGGIARQSHLPALLGDPRVSDRLQIVATVDDAPGVAPLPGTPHFTNVEGLRAVVPLDFVDICTRTASHLPLTLWALEHGYHVLCEKPVALDRDEARRVADAARRHGRVVVPCHQHRHNPVWRQVQQWLADGVIGRWHLAEIDVYRSGADRGSVSDGTPWRGLAGESRGGILLDHGTHLLYQLLDAGGIPSHVRAWTGRLRQFDYDVEDSALLTFEYPNRMAKLFLTWAARHRENRLRFVGDRGSIEWVGGTLRLEREGTTECFDRSAELDKSAYAGWFATLFGQFADAMSSGAAEPFLNDIASVATLLECSYESARTGARLAVGT